MVFASNASAASRRSHGFLPRASIGTMQSLLGHSTPEITREIYLHAIPEEQRRAVENVERDLSLDPNGPKFKFRRYQRQQE